jgi:hypothetical protein
MQPKTLKAIENHIFHGMIECTFAPLSPHFNFPIYGCHSPEGNYMKYNAHRLFHRTDGGFCLRRELVITDPEREKLRDAQRKVRQALRHGLAVAGAYLQDDDRFAVRAAGVTDTRALAFTPKFKTQGSWAYNTLNRPAQTGQQLDLDDGMYVPMSMVEGSPRLAATVLFSVVERILDALCRAEGWTLFTEKNICVRVILDTEAHLDLNIYAIPDEKMAVLEKAMKSAGVNALDSATARTAAMRLDPQEIYVAHRKKGWEQSDPLQLEDWFLKAASRHSAWIDLRRVVRYLKAWRDLHWSECRLSSLILMVCAIEALDEAATRPLSGRDDDGLLVVARALHLKLSRPIYNPVIKDRRLEEWETLERSGYELKARALMNEIDGALNHETTSANVVSRMRKLFGNRIPNDPALVAVIASIAAVRSTEASPSPSPRVGSRTSG